MRLIDADALIIEANKDGAYGYVDAKQIADAPTVDAEPVVRCEHCQYSKEWNRGRWCKVFRDSVSADWYCSLGKA